MMSRGNLVIEFKRSKKPSDFGIWITMASNYVNLNDIDNALSCIEKCKKIDPSNYLINYQLAYINSHTGNRKKSIELIKMVLEHKLQEHKLRGKFYRMCTHHQKKYHK